MNIGSGGNMKKLNFSADDAIIIPLSDKIADDAAEILREAFPLCYGGNYAAMADGGFGGRSRQSRRDYDLSWERR